MESANDHAAQTRLLSEESHWARNAFLFEPREQCWLHVPSDPQALRPEPAPRRWRHWCLLVLGAVLTAALTLGINFTAALLRKGTAVLGRHAIEYRIAAQTLMPVGAYMVGVALTAHSKKPIAQFVPGGAIPEMKCELSGVHLVGFFNYRIFLAKCIGLVLNSGAGLPVGMEGPFCYMAAAMMHFCGNRRWFRGFRAHSDLRGTTMTAAVALGVGVAFNAPIAGVLFALELLDNFGSVGHLQCFLCATVAGLTDACVRYFVPHTSIIYFPKLFDSDLRAQVPIDELYWKLLPCYVLLGLVCGVLGAIFVRLHRFGFRFVRFLACVRLRTNPADVEVGQCWQSIRGRPLKRRLCALVALVALLNSVLTWQVPLLQNNSQVELLSALTSTEQLDFGYVSLLFSACIKVVTTLMVLSLPLTIGSVAPVFVIGAFVGRLFASALVLWVDLPQPDFFVTRFALVGACAFCAGTVRSLAQVVLVFERTGLANLLLPTMAASLASVLVARSLGPSYFDSLILEKRLPYFPALALGRGALLAEELCTADVPSVTPSTSAAELRLLRRAFPDWRYEVPLVSQLAWPSKQGKPAKRALLVSAIRGLHTASTDWLADENLVVPLQVEPEMTLKRLLPLMAHSQKSVAFVTRHGQLLGAVTLGQLYRACQRRTLPGPSPVPQATLGDAPTLLRSRHSGSLIKKPSLIMAPSRIEGHSVEATKGTALMAPF